MTLRNGLVAGLSIATLLIAAGPSFVPAATFKGSALHGCQPLGDADWRASSGEIIGTPKSAAGGWLFMNLGLQDLRTYTSFRCAAGDHQEMSASTLERFDQKHRSTVARTETPHARSPANAGPPCFDSCKRLPNFIDAEGFL